MVSTKSIVLAAATLFAAASAAPAYGSSGGSSQTQQQCSGTQNYQCCNPKSSSSGGLLDGLSLLSGCTNVGVSVLDLIPILNSGGNPCTGNQIVACCQNTNQNGLINLNLLQCSPITV
ncbi:hypothetical protein GQ53DRAFT_832555 [Thozetella sp. PMI_491]|nr:hypothetical protein GQ53DRAFT_832555 [Thozetella sp. PMI_491]